MCVVHKCSWSIIADISGGRKLMCTMHDIVVLWHTFVVMLIIVV